MQIIPDPNDASDFVAIVNQITSGLLDRDAPSSLILIKVNNWFGFKWRNFSGKGLGVVPVWKHNLTVPPFVPSRIVSQRRFAAPLYEEIDCGEPVHLRLPSREAMKRPIAEVAPGAAFVWFSGNSKITGRGSLMAYLPGKDSYSSWYAGFSHRERWAVEKTQGIKRGDLPGTPPSA
jgi:hypothetical protein